MSQTSPLPIVDEAAGRNLVRRRVCATRALVSVAGALVIWILLGWLPGPIGAPSAATLPWSGAVMLVLLGLSLVVARRSALVVVAGVAVWILAMLPAFPALPGAPAADRRVVVAAQNVQAGSGGAADSARALAAEEAGVVALTELDADSRAAAAAALGADYPYDEGVGTAGLWSTFPIRDREPLELGLGWKRALRAVIETPSGDLTIYLIHAASVRPGEQQARDTMLANLAEVIQADDAERVLVVGDFNAASTDPALGPLRSAANWVRPTGPSLGLTWPSAFPLVRIDHVFARGMQVEESTEIPAGASDHRATLTTVTL